MNGLITLTLLDLRFFAYHGWYAQEAEKGQPFLINLWITYPEPDTSVEQLDQTIDYTLVYDLLDAQMKKPRKLLEELAQSILSEIHDQFPRVSELKIHIQKISPPVAGLDGRLGIELLRRY
ncbi:MAG: dihydroneopterin aldolase [Bacteroidetes bacterium]|nr:dihydroneopterin aldolase [Bacteroidota bacterium]